LIRRRLKKFCLNPNGSLSNLKKKRKGKDTFLEGLGRGEIACDLGREILALRGGWQHRVPSPLIISLKQFVQGLQDPFYTVQVEGTLRGGHPSRLSNGIFGAPLL
jgi:hypothetical protein